MNARTSEYIREKVERLKRRKLILDAVNIFLEILLFAVLAVALLVIGLRVIMDVAGDYRIARFFTALYAAGLISVMLVFSAAVSAASVFRRFRTGRDWILALDGKMFSDNGLSAFMDFKDSDSAFLPLIRRNVSVVLESKDDTVFTPKKIGYRWIILFAIATIVIAFSMPFPSTPADAGTASGEDKSTRVIPENEYVAIPLLNARKAERGKPSTVFGEDERKKGTAVPKFVNPLLGMGEDILKKVSLPENSSEIKSAVTSEEHRKYLDSYKRSLEEAVIRDDLRDPEIKIAAGYFDRIKDLK